MPRTDHRLGIRTIESGSGINMPELLDFRGLDLFPDVFCIDIFILFGSIVSDLEYD